MLSPHEEIRVTWSTSAASALLCPRYARVCFVSLVSRSLKCSYFDCVFIPFTNFVSLLLG